MGYRIQKEANKIMKCAACHSEMVHKNGEIDLRIEGRLYLVRNISYDECLSCGEKVLSPKLSQGLFEKIRDGKFIEETVRIPVLDGTYG